MTSKTEELYLAEYERLERIRLGIYESPEQSPDALIYSAGVLLAHGRLLKQLITRAVYLEQDLQDLRKDLHESQDLVAALKDTVNFLEDQLEWKKSWGK